MLQIATAVVYTRENCIPRCYLLLADGLFEQSRSRSFAIAQFFWLVARIFAGSGLCVRIDKCVRLFSTFRIAFWPMRALYKIFAFVLQIMSTRLTAAAKVALCRRPSACIRAAAAWDRRLFSSKMSAAVRYFIQKYICFFTTVF